MLCAIDLRNSRYRGAEPRPGQGRGSGRFRPMLRPQIRNIGLEAAKTAGAEFSPHGAVPELASVDGGRP